MKGLIVAALALFGLRYLLTRFRRFADPDPSIYGRPGERA